MDQLQKLIRGQNLSPEDGALLLQVFEAMAPDTQNMLWEIFSKKPHWLMICANNLKEKIAVLKNFNKKSWEQIINNEGLVIEKELS